MAFTDALTVAVGDATKKTQYDQLADNPEWLREKADVDHDFDISTGTGYHKASHTSPVHFYNGSNHMVMWIDYETDATKPQLRVKFASGSVPTVNSVSDGQPIQAGPETAAPTL